MTAPKLYPLADHTTQWFETQWPGTTMPHPNTFLLHSTEGGDWPDYNIDGAGNGSGAPTFTYHPGERKFRQHFPVNKSARGLVHAGDPATNRLSVILVKKPCF